MSDQRQNNLDTDGYWQSYGTHRDQVMAQLLGSTGRATRGLVLLGAGNLNDVELPRLVARFGEVRLVDLDADAVARGIARQGGDGIRTHAPCDITGTLDLDWRADPRAAIRRARTVPPPIDGLYGTVASCCMLSQAVSRLPGLPIERDLAMQAMVAVRDRHLEHVALMVRRKGRGLVITDVTSSDTLPALLEPDADPRALLDQATREQNVFFGTSPDALWAAVERPALGSLISKPQQLEPWIWRMGQRAYLVTGLRFDRR